MNLLVTAGNTQTPIDRVRCITNIFSGRTGATIAAAAFDRGHAVTLVTSHPEVLAAIPGTRERREPHWRLRTYRTFDELESRMAGAIPSGGIDAIVQAAAVSDYRVVGVFTQSPDGLPDVAAGKVKGSHPELWIKLTLAPKLIDRVRTDWGFTGVLVKFKLEVGVTDAELLDIAERSRVHSGADLMCANTLEGMHEWAWLGAGPPGGYRRISRANLAAELIGEIEKLAR
jgi:phosphopantothenate-cysteine ligase/phosphopantothenoylcysteine decarboxylase/phosphopantothenate--cysteine ligase